MKHRHRTLKQRASETAIKQREGFGWLEVNPTGKKVAVIMHGVTGGKDDMLPLAERYGELGYAVYCPDLPGHGESAMIAGDEFRELGDWLQRYLEVISRVPTVIVSNSYASAVVYQYMQLGYLPAHTHVVLGCPTPYVAPLTQLLDRAGQLLPDRLTWYVYNTAPFRATRTRYLYRGTDSASHLWLVESEKRKYGYIAPSVSPRLSRLLFRDNPYLLPPLPEDIQRRITVVLGERDNVITRKTRRYLQEILPHATWVSAGPAGHILHFEAPESLVRDE